jgi:D-alanyl-D-alanine dipeptidase
MFAVPQGTNSPVRHRPRGLGAPIVLFCLIVTQSLLAQSDLAPAAKPPDVPQEWKDFIGDYGPADGTQDFLVFERNGELILARISAGEAKLRRVSPNDFTDSATLIPRTSNPPLHRDSNGIVSLQVDGIAFSRHYYSAQGGPLHKISTTRSVDDLRQAALLASPPLEQHEFRPADLVDVATLDSTIRLDIRYATSNNFLGTPVYSQARAFLERPAAQALLRVHKKLAPLGYGLLVHDAYRPWYVTKIFWDATPPEGKVFVADPAQGSRHNRGCAVDLTLYELKSGRPIEMTGFYDEMSPRSYPSYPGGTTLQRWHRDLLRRAMEFEGFSVFDSEWWHFDYKDWREYPILNIPFEKLGAGQGIGVH